MRRALLLAMPAGVPSQPLCVHHTNGIGQKVHSALQLLCIQSNEKLTSGGRSQLGHGLWPPDAAAHRPPGPAQSPDEAGIDVVDKSIWTNNI